MQVFTSMTGKQFSPRLTLLILAVRFPILAGVAELVDDVQDVLVSRRTGRPGVTDIQDVLMPRTPIWI